MCFLFLVLAFYRLTFIDLVSSAWYLLQVLFLECVKSCSLLWVMMAVLHLAFPELFLALCLLWLKSWCCPGSPLLLQGEPYTLGFTLVWCRQAETKCRSPCLIITRVFMAFACVFGSVGDSRVQKQECWGGDGHLIPCSHPSTACQMLRQTMWGTSWSPPQLQGLGCLTALWNDFLNIPCLLFLMPSEASPRVGLQGKDKAARCVWKCWLGHTPSGYSCSVLCCIRDAFFIFKAFPSHELRATH